MTNDPLTAVAQLVTQWRTMCANAYQEGPIPDDEIGHQARWTAVEMCADELDRALAALPRPQEEDRSPVTVTHTRLDAIHRLSELIQAEVAARQIARPQEPKP